MYLSQVMDGQLTTRVGPTPVWPWVVATRVDFWRNAVYCTHKNSTNHVVLSDVATFYNTDMGGVIILLFCVLHVSVDTSGGVMA